ncbi:MAG: NERD domain-containing protein [Anaerolineaceae bacterium]
MKIIRNDKLIKRNGKISQYVLIAALTTLVVGIYLTITKSSPEEIGWAYLFLIPSYILVQVSIAMGNRWSRSPRPDEVVAQSLKGLDNQYSLYIFTTSIPHLLIGPAGIWIIKTYHQSGKIFVDEKKGTLKQKGGGNFFTRIFASEGIGNVVKETEELINRLEKYFQKQEISNSPEIKAVNVFLSPEVVLDVPTFTETIITPEKLKDFFRRTDKQVNMSSDEIEKLTNKLPAE